MEQLEFRPRLPIVVGNADYAEQERLLRRMDEILRASHLSDAVCQRGTEQWLQQRREDAARRGVPMRTPTAKQLARFQRMCRQAFRCNLARHWLGKEFRTFSLRLAQSPLLQWFCQVDRMEEIRVPSKSTLERFDKLLPEPEVRALVTQLNGVALAEENRLELECVMRMDAILADTTCVAANIHFPVDWVLLRDAVRTLMKAILVIRRHGLKHRMPDPDKFLRQINQLCIAMSQRRQKDSARNRKIILRRMKELAHVVRAHAERYASLLEDNWARQTALRAGEANRIVGRIRGVVAQLPAAIRQAHERIIGGRPVPNDKKILSLYEPDVHLIVRHKAGRDVEFGNTLFVAEQTDGLIVDWKLNQEQSPGDVALLEESLHRIHAAYGDYPGAVAADRGFASKKQGNRMTKAGILDATCPRNPQELSHRMEDDQFRLLQKRRAQTEGRIGIVKNAFLGAPLRGKGFAHRQLIVAWAVFTHNLWLLARRPRKKAPLAHAA